MALLVWCVLLLSVFYFSLHVYDRPPCVLCVIIVCILHYVSTLSRFVMALLPTTDSRRFLQGSWLAFVCKFGERMNVLCEYVYKLSVLFLLVGLWWSFLCVVCYYCLCFISFSRFVMTLLTPTDSHHFLPRSWLAFVCNIGERMHYVSMFITCLFYFS